MPEIPTVRDVLSPLDTFVSRHNGPREEDVQEMLKLLGYGSVAELMDAAIPAGIRTKAALDIGPMRGEHELLGELQQKAGENQRLRSFIGMGYSGCVVPSVILRNILENPGWYTAYTPYQPEIAQGRLEALFVFQTMVADLTALPLANASLLDEATAAAEAMALCHRAGRGKKSAFLVDQACHPQTIAVVQTRADALGIEVHVGDAASFDLASIDLFGALLQYPDTEGRIYDLAPLCDRIHDAGGLAVVACDLLALTLLRPPGEFGADVAVGSAQRFGVPMGYGGPHAAFIATKEAYKRQIPGRIIGLSKDAQGKPALRMAMQTREQHIRREKATSNICTAQVLLAIMAGIYGVYHGPDGLRTIARRIHGATRMLAVRRLGDKRVGIALDETVTRSDLEVLLECFAGTESAFSLDDLAAAAEGEYSAPHRRESDFMLHSCFSSHQSEHELLRYLHRLEARDLSLNTSMISLGSCTMKLNGTSEMIPITWPGFTDLHPFVPWDQARGYHQMFEELERWLSDITGLSAVSLQPNAGAQGEYTGLLVIRAYHRSRGQAERDVCLIPVSAHGTNPASAIMAGMKVVIVACDDGGNIALDDLRAKADQHADRVAALMVTYPSTHGVFEEEIAEICKIVHDHGGQVYLDGANLNAQVGYCRPGEYGADVCHLNLHKTFAIPHGGGGPGMGPIAVAEHLAPFLPGHPVVDCGGDESIGAVAAAPWGSACVLPISWMYVALMGSEGLTRATEIAVLNANYMAKRLEGHVDVLYTGKNGRVGHEFIVELRPFKQSAGVEAEDVAKRLMDYGFHAPTMSFPVPGTLMIEPTESEPKEELDRLCDALISIVGEIKAVESGELPRDDNPLKNAPHTAEVVSASEWNHPYSREQAAYPAPWTRDQKFWPAVGRVDNAYGDRNLICTLPAE
jgi:glycine dehydrogenase